MNDNAIIPPVEAGTITSSIEIDYDHERRGEGGFEARGEHRWQFDSRAYHDYTGLDIGGDYPYVAQENGHSLRLVTDYTWTRSDHGDEVSYTLALEQKAVRGVTSIDDVYWTRCGHYTLDEDCIVQRTHMERQQYPIRESDDDVLHFEPYDLTGVPAYSGEDVVYGLHMGRNATPVKDELHDLIAMDSPDRALTVEDYLAVTDNDEHQPVPSDD